MTGEPSAPLPVPAPAEPPAIESGLSAFPLTPIRDGRIDDSAVVRIIERLAGAGGDSIGALGSTGSYACLTREERARIVRLTTEHAGDVPVIVGIGALRTEHVLALAEDAQPAGAAGVLIAVTLPDESVAIDRGAPGARGAPEPARPVHGLTDAQHAEVASALDGGNCLVRGRMDRDGEACTMAETGDQHAAFPTAETVEDFAANPADVRTRIDAAAARSGRDGRAVRLLPVSKTVPQGRIRLAVAAGRTQLGENKVQEAARKHGEMSDLDVDCAVIGHLQRNNARDVAAFAAEFHALDSLRVAEALDRTRPGCGSASASCGPSAIGRAKRIPN